MKNFIGLIAILFIITISFGQYDSPNCPHRYDITPYVGVGLSIANSDDFAMSSYTSIEAGVMFENMTVAGVFGRSNLDHMFNNDSFTNYWYEGKIAYSFPLGFVDGYGVFGLGNYIGSKTIFIEYGGGISKVFNDHFGASIQISNWDGSTYFSPSIFVTF